MSTSQRPRLLIIDGHSMAFRAFFALPEPNFRTTAGEPTNAVYGFMSMLTNLLRDFEPTHVGVAFDIGRTTFRTRMFEAYKGTRESTPEGFRGQVPLIKEVLQALRIPTLEKEDYEADDILATWSRQGKEAGMEVFICSGDRDSLQLVNGDVTVLYPVKGVSELAHMTPDAVVAKYGVTPEQYPDLAALVGETSDNIPGVPGVGPKTAAKWLGQYGSLGEILDHAGDIKGKAGESLRSHAEQVALNRQLNRLLDDLELDLSPADLERRPANLAELHGIFDALQIGGLRDRLLALVSTEEGVSHASAQREVTVVEVSDDEFASWLSGLKDSAIHVEGSGGAVNPDAWSIAIADETGTGAYVDLKEATPVRLDALSEFLRGTEKAVHSAKLVRHRLSARGIDLGPVSIDTELAGYLLHPDQRAYQTSDLAERYLDQTFDVAAGDSAQGMLDLDLDTDSAALGAVARAAQVAALAPVLRGKLEADEELSLLTDLELPLSIVLAEMEQVGIAVDTARLDELEGGFAAQAQQAAREAYDVIGREVNLGSPKQLQEVLFEQLDMPKTKKIKTGYTTNAAALEDLFAKTGHPFLQHLLVHRDVTKLRQIVETLRKSVHYGRIHSTFQQTIAATGRLSSTEPNLQNIPIRTDAGRQIRSVFVVGDGYDTLVTADYSQIEMRIMAHLSGDAGLIEAFRSGEDLHRFVGARVFGVEPADVDGAMRSKVKAMSYGLAYGLSVFGLSEQLKIDVEEARDLRSDYFERFGGVRDYLSSVVEDARQTGWTQTILGRRRYLPDLTSDNRQRREMAERMALNAPIQGSAADIIKVAMLGVDRELRERGLRSRLLLQIHDELLVEVAAGERDEVESVLRTEMAGAVELSVPLDVSVGIGPNWEIAGH